MSSYRVPKEPESAHSSATAGFTRPLRLTPSEDFLGFVLSHAGRLFLFGVTCFSVLAVLLIFYFVIQGAFPFITHGGMEEFLDGIPAGNMNTFFERLAEQGDANKKVAEFLEQQTNGALAALQMLHPNEGIYQIVTTMPEEELRAVLKGKAKNGFQIFITSKNWFPTGTPPEYGALAIIFGSLFVTIGALVVAVPLGMMAAVFLSDIAPFNIRQICKPIIEILAAIPSVAYGFFAVVVLAPFLQKTFGFPTGTNALNSALILAVMALPTIISVSEDSLSAIGREIREASYGLGATRSETMLKVVIPAAHSGIVAAVILGMMRAIGETMVVWMASGNANQIPSPFWDISQSIRTMTGTIAGEMGESPVGSIHRQSLFGIGSLLLIFTFGLNMISEYFMTGFRKSKGGRK